MTFEEFIYEWQGKKCDYDKAFGPQCVDLFRQYSQDVNGTPHTGVVSSGAAKDLFLEYDNLPIEKKYYKKVRTPKFGDIVFYDKTDSNEYGHVAIFISKVGKSSHLVFEQNGITQDGAKIVLRSNNKCLGFLRKR